mmetsp:Transcript_134486/g.348350  ORF Transcript_134486/g.348350 Transcript_134486/m.348350 type:complete len:237 (-) Transcript_134486:933-1643(-)
MFGPWMTSAALSKSCESKLYCCSRPSMEACHSWSDNILPMTIRAISQIHATRFAGPSTSLPFSWSLSSSSSCSVAWIAKASNVAKSFSSMERSSPMNVCSSVWCPSHRFCNFSSKLSIALTSSTFQSPLLKELNWKAMAFCRFKSGVSKRLNASWRSWLASSTSLQPNFKASNRSVTSGWYNISGTNLRGSIGGTCALSKKDCILSLCSLERSFEGTLKGQKKRAFSTTKVFMKTP